MVYDLIVLGGGPAGYLGAERAGHAGLKTLLIEKQFLGGVCLNEGCIPSKTLLHSAKLYDYARFSEKYGVTSENVEFDQNAVVARKNKVVKSLVAGVRGKMRANKVKVLEGKGEIVGRGTHGYKIKIGSEIYEGKRLLIATGSSPILPPIEGLQEGLSNGFVLTNREILNLKEIPESLVVIGGGIVGMEMASYFNSAGSNVTVIEMLDHIAGDIDRQIAEILKKNYEKKGIAFHLNSKATSIKKDGVAYENNGKEYIVNADKVLISIGRQPIVDGFGLEKIGVEIDKEAIKVDEIGKTNVPEVYAAGDVNGYSMLAHTAYREAEVCINSMLGKKDYMRYNAIPSVIYTNPEVACIGETEESARVKGIETETKTISMRYSGRNVAENEGGDGICKMVINKKLNTLLGVHLIANPTSEIIYGVAPFIETEMRLEDIKEIVFPHPTISEIIRESVFQFE